MKVVYIPLKKISSDIYMHISLFQSEEQIHRQIVGIIPFFFKLTTVKNELIFNSDYHILINK